MQNKDENNNNNNKPKPSALGWGMAKKAAEALVSRKKKNDLAIKEAGG